MKMPPWIAARCARASWRAWFDPVALRLFPATAIFVGVVDVVQVRFTDTNTTTVCGATGVRDGEKSHDAQYKESKCTCDSERRWTGDEVKREISLTRPQNLADLE